MLLKQQEGQQQQQQYQETLAEQEQASTKAHKKDQLERQNRLWIVEEAKPTRAEESLMQREHVTHAWAAHVLDSAR